jgi:hypothetical protein
MMYICTVNVWVRWYVHVRFCACAHVCMCSRLKRSAVRVLKSLRRWLEDFATHIEQYTSLSVLGRHPIYTRVRGIECNGY